MLARPLRVIVIGAAALAATVAVAAPTLAGSAHHESAPAAPVQGTALAAEDAHSGVQQGVSVAVNGGALTLRQSTVDVILRRNAATERYEGRATFDVVDARGTLSGWSLRVVPQLPSAVRGSAVRLRPSRPTVIDGSESGLLAGPRASVKNGQVATLGSASPGDGGGSYRVDTSVELSTTGGGSHPDAITIALVPQVVGG